MYAVLLQFKSKVRCFFSNMFVTYFMITWVHIKRKCAKLTRTIKRVVIQLSDKNISGACLFQDYMLLRKCTCCNLHGIRTRICSDNLWHINLCNYKPNNSFDVFIAYYCKQLIVNYVTIILIDSNMMNKSGAGVSLLVLSGMLCRNANRHIYQPWQALIKL